MQNASFVFHSRQKIIHWNDRRIKGDESIFIYGWTSGFSAKTEIMIHNLLLPQCFDSKCKVIFYSEGRLIHFLCIIEYAFMNTIRMIFLIV